MNKIKEKLKSFYDLHIKKHIEKVKDFFEKHEYLKVFSVIFGCALVCFLPNTIPNGLTIPMGGDYCLQQLHFYCEGHDAFWHFIKTGEVVMWSGESFLGVNYFAANTFYYISSPFLLPFIFTPKILIPHMLFLMLLVKIATGGTFFYILMKKYHHTTSKTSLIGAVAYGLCGWGMYYLWFNHFHDVLALFPLLLIGIEHILQNKKGWILSLSLMLVGMANYFFLFGFAILGVFYALFRYIQLFKQNKGNNLSIILNGIAYYVLGIGMVAFVLLPAFGIVMGQTRVEGSSLLLNFFALFFENPVKDDSGYTLGSLKSLEEMFSAENLEAIKNYFFVFSADKNTQLKHIFVPISQTLFPSVNNWDSTLFKNQYFENYQSSMFISFPLIIMLGIKIIETIKKHNIFSILAMIIAIALPLIPFTYYVLNAFSLMYGRWELFLVAIMLVNALPMLDKLNDIKKWEVDVSFILAILLMGTCIYVAISTENMEFGNYREYVVFGYLIYCFLVYYLIRFDKKGESAYENILLLTMVEVIVCGFITTTGQGTQNYWQLYGGQHRMNEQRTIINDINKEDDDYFRIENVLEDRSNNNISMTLGYNSLSAFHSVYNKNLHEFINTYSRASYSNGNWSMGIDEKRANLNEFLGVKYEIVEKGDTNIPFGYELYKSYEYFDVYENTNYIELGFSFTSLIDQKAFNVFNASHFNYEALMLRHAVIENDDIDEVCELMENEERKTAVYAPFTTSYNLRYSIKPRENEEFSEVVGVFGDLKRFLPEERNGNLYGPWVANNMSGDIIRIVNSNNSYLIPEGNHHVIAKLNYGSNVHIRFYNKEGELVVEDSHGVNYYDHSGDHKYARGFYTDEAIYKVEIELIADVPYNQFSKSGFGLYYQSYDSYLKTVNTLKETAVKNVTHSANTFNFETDYDEQRFVVLNIPNDEGWTLTDENGETIKIYQCNGGFIGFIAEEGTHKYKLNYVTPDLMVGIGISAGSTVIFLLLTISSYYIPNKKKKLIK